MAPAVIVALAVAVGCGGGGDTDGDGDEAAPAARPTRTPRPSPTSDPNQAPLFAPGRWTGGEATVTVSGGATSAVAGTLLERSSSSDAQNTRLTYTKDLDTINISISRQYQPFSMVVSKQPVYLDQGTCEVTYKSKEEKRIEGTFKCTDVDVEQGGNGQPTTVEGTFLATR